MFRSMRLSHTTPIGATALVIACLLLGLPSAAAQSQSDFDQCGKDGDFEACSRVIDAGKEKGWRLASTYLMRCLISHGSFTFVGGDANADGAIADCTKVLEMQIPIFLPLAYELRGNIRLEKGEFERAIADFGQVLRIMPKGKEKDLHKIFFARGKAYAGKGDRKRAAADYREVIKRTSGDEEQQALYKEASEELGRATGDYSSLLDYHAKNIKKNPDSASTYNSRAWTFHIAGRDPEGLADAEKAVELKPNEANYLDTRGHIYERIGKIDEAIADFTKAIGLDDKLLSSYYGRALAYEKKGDTASAIADFRSVLALTADNDNEKAWQRSSQEKLASLTRTSALMQASTAKRVALVIGNSAYTAVSVLPNPKRDAEAVAAALKTLGFQTVTLAADLTRERLTATLRDFARVSEAADWSLVYFAGHGLEVGGVNYLVPTDAKLEVDRDVPFEAVPLDHVVSAVEPAKKLRMVLLDACRHNPFIRQMRRSVASRGVGSGLAEPASRAGFLIVYAAKHGEIALDGDSGANSPFAAAFLKRATKSGVDLRRLFDLVRDDVLAATGRRQQPFTYGSLPGSEEFFF